MFTPFRRAIYQKLAGEYKKAAITLLAFLEKIELEWTREFDTEAETAQESPTQRKVDLLRVMIMELEVLANLQEDFEKLL